MLIKNTTCTKCGALYDEHLGVCPNCRTVNDSTTYLQNNDRLCWLSLPKQVILFFVGCIGLQIVSLIVSIFCMNIYKQNEVRGTALISFISYGLMFIVFFIILFKDRFLLKHHFIKVRPYIAGLVGGIILIVGSEIIGLIFQTIYPSINSNQSTSISIVEMFPILSIFVLGILGPIFEEFTYRVGFFNFFKRINTKLAYILGTLIFAFMHISIADFSTTAILSELVSLPSYLYAGFVLCFIYDKEGPAASMTAHIINNLLSIFSIIVSKVI